MTWSKGQPWRVVNGLNTLNTQIRAYAPRAVPPATPADAWGALADNAHSTSSDHYPHTYTVFGTTAVVCARDFPNAPTLGLDAWTVCEHLRKARDIRIQYIICNGKITGRNYGWTWQTYTGDDPHNTHFHISSVHSGVADSAAPWSLPGQSAASTGDDMTPGESQVLMQTAQRIEALLKNRDSKTQTGTAGVFATEPNALAAAVAAAGGTVEIDQATRDALALAAGQAVKDALGAGGALEARLTAWANSADGRAAIVAAVNVAEDS